MKTLVGFVLGISLVACGTDKAVGPETLPELIVPPPPDNGMQVITPVFGPVQAGLDYEVCTWTDQITTEQTDVRATLAYQTEPPGHHAILFYTTEKQPPGTQRICTDSDMATFRFLAGNGGNGEMNVAPGNLVYRIPAGAQIVVNHHYLNATDKDMSGQTAVNLYFADPGQEYIPSGNTAITNTSLMVEEGVTTQEMHAVVNRTMKLWYFAPHMHRWGSDITIKINGEPLANIGDTKWQPAYTFHPPEHRLDPATPMILHDGDKIDVACTWNNTSGRQLGFGFEMCVAFGQYVDDEHQGNWAWDNGSWTVF
jgi:hypothetical protein